MRTAPLCALLLVTSPLLRAQGPTVSLSLPRGSDPASAKIFYFASGAGGYGTSVPTAHGRFDYQIHAGKQIQRADEIAIVAYIPGCEISTFRIDLRNERAPWRQVECVPLPTITLHGRIIRTDRATSPSEVVVEYDANWINRFYGTLDGFVPHWQVAVATADRDGRFSINLPDFCLQTYAGDASDSLQNRPLCEGAQLEFSERLPPNKGYLALNPRNSRQREFIPKLAYPDEVQFEECLVVH